MPFKVRYTLERVFDDADLVRFTLADVQRSSPFPMTPTPRPLITINGIEPNHVVKGNDSVPLFFNLFSRHPELDTFDIIQLSNKQLYLRIEDANDDSFFIRVRWNDTIFKVKQMIATTYHIPQSNLKLLKGTTQLRCNEILSNIMACTQIHLNLEIQERQELSVTVKEITGKTFSLNLTNLHTVQEVKARIGHRKRQCYREIVLLHSGKILEDQETLFGCEIKNGDEIWFVPRMHCWGCASFPVKQFYFGEDAGNSKGTGTKTIEFSPKSHSSNGNFIQGDHREGEDCARDGDWQRGEIRGDHDVTSLDGATCQIL